MQTRIVFPLSTELTLTAELMYYIYYPHLARIKVLQYLYQNVRNICHLLSTLHLTPNIPNYVSFYILEIYDLRNLNAFVQTPLEQIFINRIAE